MSRFFSFVIVCFLALVSLPSCGKYQAAATVNEPSGQELSMQLLNELKGKKPVKSTINQLAALDPQALLKELDTKDKQLAFWVNIYNGMMQHLLTSQPTLWENRQNLFAGERVTVAGKLLSPEMIEHGIIRGGEAKLGLGFVPKFFPSKFERSFKIEGGDPRVHFALNCGAIDCPPVEIYDAATVSERLDHRTKVYLKKHTSVDTQEETIVTTPLFSWFKGDFKTYGGIDDFLVHFGIITEAQKSFARESKDYDWTLATNVYAED